MPPAKKKPNEKSAVPKQRNFSAVFWTVAASKEWSGLTTQCLLGLIREGVIKAVKMGPPQSFTDADGSVRRRSCTKYLVVRESLVAYVDGLRSGELMRRRA
jgi:hypothetical protein